MSINNALFTSNSDEWETPIKLFDYLNSWFNFTLDPCATTDNAKCPLYFTKEQNGLLQDWKGHRVFCNPPYSQKGNQDAWVKKCYEESLKENTIVVALLPARTDTVRFHKYILNNSNVFVTYIQGRLKFGNSTNSAPFPSMIVNFNKNPIYNFLSNTLKANQFI